MRRASCPFVSCFGNYIGTAFCSSLIYSVSSELHTYTKQFSVLDKRQEDKLDTEFNGRKVFAEFRLRIEDGSRKFLRIVGNRVQNYMASHPTRLPS